MASDPPEQVLLTRSVGLSGAQSPAPRGAFCFGLLTDPMAFGAVPISNVVGSQFIRARNRMGGFSIWRGPNST